MKRLFLLSIASALIPTFVFAATPTPQATSTINPADKAKIEEIVHQYLVRKPEVVLEAIQTLQRKQYEQAEQTVKKTQSDANKFADALFHNAKDPVAGNPDGKISVVEFFDYQCPHCVDMAPVVETIIKSNPDVRFVFKEFPIRGALSDFASRAALAANLQGKYYEFSHGVLTAKQPLSQDGILEVAKEVGLDVDKLKKDMNDSQVSNQLKSNSKLGQDLKLLGTPAFFIAKTDTKNSPINYVPGQMNEQQLNDEIAKVK